MTSEQAVLKKNKKNGLGGGEWNQKWKVVEFEIRFQMI